MEITDLMAWKKLFCKDTEDWRSVIKASFVETNLYYTLLSFYLFFHLACAQQTRQSRLPWNWRNSSRLGAGPALQGLCRMLFSMAPASHYQSQYIPFCLCPSQCQTESGRCHFQWKSPAKSLGMRPPRSTGQGGLFRALTQPGCCPLVAFPYLSPQQCLPAVPDLCAKVEEGRYGCPTVTPVNGGDDAAGWWCHHGCWECGSKLTNREGT